MDRLWRQGVAFSVLVHAGVMGGGTLWAWLYSQPPTPPAPVRATLVGPETRTGAAEPEENEAQDAQQTAEEEAQPAEAPKSEPKPAPEPVTKSAPATSPKERVAEPAPEKAPEPEPKKEPEPDPDPGTEKAEPEPDAAEDPPATESEPDSASETESAPSSSAQAEAKGGGEAKADEDLLEGLGQAIDEAVTGGQGKGGQRLQAAQARFSAAVKKRISNRWSIPPGLRDRDDLEVTVRVALTPAGELERPPEVVRSNGPGYFNGSVVRAVKKAAPFPMPEGPTRAFQALKLRFSPDEVQ